MKKYALLLILILTFIIVFISPVNALNIQKLDENSVSYHIGDKHSNNKHKYSTCFNEYNKKCKYYGYSQVRMYITGNNKEINNIKYTTIKINKKTMNIYDSEKYKSNNKISINKYIKGNLQDKKYSINLYNKQKKLIKSEEGKINNFNTFLRLIISSH